MAEDRLTEPQPEAANTRAQETPALAVRGITKYFGALAANNGIDLTVARGEVHALLGENGAGKSTLMKIIFGLLRPDSGEIEVKGRISQIRSPREALDLGIGMLHQEFVLVPDMTVAENLALAATRRAPGPNHVAAAAAYVTKIADRSGFAVAPEDVVGTLSVGAQQRVEILKLLYRGAEVLILDEPSAVLTHREWVELEAMLRALVDEGKSIILITHKMDEIFSVADRCTVLRGGRTVGSTPIAETTKAKLANMMVGREVLLRTERPICEPGDEVLALHGISTNTFARVNLHELSLTVREGEVLGIAGVEGNGQRELVEALSGLAPLSAGRIHIGGTELSNLSPQLLTSLGVGVVTEDRRRSGLAVRLPVVDNLMARAFRALPYSHRGILRWRTMRSRSAEMMRDFDVRGEGIDVPVRQLSGGNQQKLMLAREMSDGRRVLIAAQPTRGLDVGAIEQVYALLNAFKLSGGALLLISTELDEIFSLSDRIAVMSDGRLTGTLDAADATIDRVGRLMAGETLADLDDLDDLPNPNHGSA